MTKYEVLRGCWIILVGLLGYDQFVTKICKTMDKRSQLETSKKVGTLANARTATYNGRAPVITTRARLKLLSHKN